ncbi:MAG: tetratricopeptide repeat protein [bacterium]|nr:tetratricopeptide repeat protein [bacterium]
MTVKIGRHVLALLVLLALVGCAGSGKEWRYGEAAWQRQVELAKLSQADVVYPFEQSPEMLEFAQKIENRYRNFPSEVKLKKLQRALFNREVFEFKLDDQLTLTAPEAFLEQRGNCLSFTSLFVGLARSMGIGTFLVAVDRAPEVNREDGLVVVNRHIVAGFLADDRLLLYDFFINVHSAYKDHRFIDDVTASAMYHNNLGGRAIRNGDLAAAQKHLEIATKMDPELALAWINLGVLRFEAGDVQGSLDAYRRALIVEPGSSSALKNIAFVHHSIGNEEEADAALRAAAHGQATPFTLIAIADAELAQGDLKAANKLLKRAKRQFHNEPEVYIALARLAEHNDELRKADKYRRRAEELREDRERDSS